MISKIKKILEKNRVVILLIFVLIISLLAGVAGDLISRVYMFEDAYNIPFFGNISFSDNNYRGANLVIQGAKKVVVEQNIKVAEIINSINGNLAGVFKKIKTADSGLNFNPDSYYKLDQAAGLGLIITSDGWIITDALPKNLSYESISGGYVVIDKDKQIYKIDQVIKDTLTPFSFIHVEGAKDFPVQQFAESKAENGQLVIAASWSGDSYLTSVIGSREKSLVRSSDNFSDELIIADVSAQGLKEAVLFDLTGRIIGFLDSEGEASPISHFQSAIKSLLKDRSIKRPSFGVNYLDLSLLAKENNKYKNGALIYKNASGVSLIKNGPAEKAGLKEGDIIIQIDNTEINGNNNLANIIQSYSAGDKINVDYLRAGEKLEAQVELGEIK
ncbi:MAG: PDZ domain-containing protein [Patescibacteria group bacterium]|nr:PDZ domain-containing protein [Patescibacteria group bacterium]MDD5295075.1 PDZ domain-containing protein [Patescibacteria group bacterium]MDD5554797.1 PDZ domain-containing protein [Patescibacteria group bacterium]